MRNRFSRRLFLGGSASSLALMPSFARAQTALTQSTAPTQGGGGKDQPAVATSNDTQEHLTVDVLINGAGPFKFVVDTGADRTVIADNVAAQLGLIPKESVLVEGIIKTIPARSVALDSVAFGTIERPGLNAPVLPRALLAADGYLGLDMIDGLKVTFDFADNVLKITEPNSYVMPRDSGPEERRLRAFGAHGRLRAVDCKVDGVPATAFIDSGAQVSTGNSELLRALAASDATAHTQLGTIPLTGVTGGLVQGRVVPISKVHMAHLKIEKSSIVIADLQIFDLWGLKDTPALLIGMNYLRPFAQVTIDYRLKEIDFKLAELQMARRA